MPISILLVRRQTMKLFSTHSCPTCGEVLLTSNVNLHISQGVFFRRRLYRCRCDSFCRYTIRWSTALWAWPLSGAFLLGFLFVAYKGSTSAISQLTHPLFVGAVYGALAGCAIAASMFFAFRTGFQLTLVPESEVSESSSKASTWRFIDYSLILLISVLWAIWRDHWSVILAVVTAIIVAEVWDFFARRRTLRLSSNKPLQIDA